MAEFIGMVHPDTHPCVIPGEYVRPVQPSGIPAPLREHACCALGELSGREWWTVGEFRYRGEDTFDTAVARRTGNGGIVYGVETAG